MEEREKWLDGARSADRRVAEAILRKAKQAGLSAPAIRAFLQGVLRGLSGDLGWIREAEIEPIQSLTRAKDLPSRENSAALLPRLAVIKLNGGLGTSMGLDAPKSLLKAKDGQTFLDIIAQQILGFRERFQSPWPAFYLMNSFRTQEDTLAFLKKYPGLPDSEGRLDFLQGKVPKLLADTWMPAKWPADEALEWCPPGHGDLYPSLNDSGLLDRWLDCGLCYLFVSNVDNLGASVDLSLLECFASSGADFMMETTRRTLADCKGGHLARRKADGRLILRELAQCAPEERDQFQDVVRHGYFNTNNLWLRLDRLKEALEKNAGSLPLPMMQNRKTLDPQNPASPLVVQMESAMGAAVECFDRAIAVEVPRSRFAPVKTTSDLLSLWSDAYVLTEDCRLKLADGRSGRPPVVSLDAKRFKILAEFESRFPDGAPSLVQCDRLEVSGNLAFEKGVVCRGSVSFSHSGSERVTIPSGEYQNGSWTF